MVSFTSSAINKSGKKFAPKAAPRRAPAAAARAGVSDRRPSATPGLEAQKAHAPPAAITSADTPQSAQVTEGPRIEDAIDSSAVAAASPQPVTSLSAATETVQPVAPQEGPIASKETPVPIQVPVQSRHERRNDVADTQLLDVHRAGISNETNIFMPPVEASIRALAQVTETTPIPTPITRPTTRTVETRESINRNECTTESITVTATSEESTPGAGAASSTTPKPSASQNKRGKSTTSDSATGTDASKPKKPRGKRKREPTPEESENIEITPTVVKMSDLCKDLRTGKKSRREMELRNLEQVEAERKEKAREKARNTPVKTDAENGSSANGGTNTTPTKPTQSGPRMRIVNGEIVVDSASLQIDQHAEAREIGEGEDVVESRLNRKINQATYGKRTKAESWDEELTDLFYRGLRMFGTDFSLISKMFPGRSRRQIKLKFNNEERKDPERIKQTLLGPSEAVDIQTYSELTNTVYEDVEVIQRELDEDKKRIEEQHDREKRQQDELMRNPSGITNDGVVSSIENNSVKKRRSISKA
ncbi:transcription factor TFIIIB component, putative [Talaromyces stipitatus ATCC 10500]|uniref:Transcription factor TFIIIB component, putative n=1 Tax=Talaromyces stipitatus (strain ATCC 10500 / CBS 375.48 / QM 6759 / NRRL 1006) TaxID=441959 RepID=B8MSP2_TALSN|nr:transcription factor TFIIIB component, putative [Talaromyces stipitatus ATCC 10500]EED12479.1 transcription factor TFIIIB component, putative [Talaromyces stipitatus ATCC 10500]